MMYRIAVPLIAVLIVLAGCSSAPGTGLKTVNPRREGGAVAATPNANAATPAAATARTASAGSSAPAVPAVPTPEQRQRQQAIEEYNRGAALEQQGKGADALAAYQAALQLDPRYAPAHVGIGNHYLMTQRYDDAERAYRSGLAADPANANAHNNLAWLYVTTKAHLDQAAELSRQAIELTKAQAEQARAANRAADVTRLQGDLSECYSTHAWVWFHRGEPKAAAAAWDSALQLVGAGQNEKKATLLYRIAMALAKAGEPGRALRSIVDARALHPSASLAVQLDALEVELGSK